MEEDLLIIGIRPRRPRAGQQTAEARAETVEAIGHGREGDVVEFGRSRYIYLTTESAEDTEVMKHRVLSGEGVAILRYRHRW